VAQYPDLSLDDSDISFSHDTALEGEMVTLNATIHNIGETTANNASILFYDGNPMNGTLIGEQIVTVVPDEAAVASIQWNATRGRHRITALVSPYNCFFELNYSNNAAYRTIDVSGHDIAVLAIVASKTVVGENHEMTIDIAVENQGDFPEILNVTLLANTTIVGKETVAAVPNGTWTILSFSWNTTGWAKGNYTISAYACSVTNETDIADNSFIFGKIAATIPGDVDGDFDVDILDVVKITGIYASDLGDLNFNGNSDINNDGQITILDVVICTGHYGQKWPQGTLARATICTSTHTTEKRPKQPQSPLLFLRFQGSRAIHVAWLSPRTWASNQSR
jgi:hypothetical protein